MFYHPTIPHRVWIAYSGDERNAKEHIHGNAKTEKKRAENFIPTRNSTKEKLKKSSGYPINVYREECADGTADLLFWFMRQIHSDYYHAVMQRCHAHYQHPVRVYRDLSKKIKSSKITLRQWYMVDNGVCSTIFR